MARPGQSVTRKRRREADELSSRSSRTSHRNISNSSYRSNENGDGGNNGSEEGDENGYKCSDLDDDEDEDGNGNGHGAGVRSSGNKVRVKGAQVLPVAEIADDWRGEAEDGATFLALANRANAKLPSVKTVHNPYHHPSPPPRTLALDDGTNQHLNRDPKDGLNHGSNQAGPSRHPALPSPEWRDCFSTHFAGYKKHVATCWSPSPSLNYPIDWPSVPTRKDEWISYINGYPRRRLRVATPPPDEPSLDVEGGEHGVGNGADNGAKQENAEDEEGGGEEGQEDVDYEEEAWMNAPPPPPRQAVYQLEPESIRHRPRPPLVSAIQLLTTSQILGVLAQISRHLAYVLDTAPPFDHQPNPLTDSRTETPQPISTPTTAPAPASNPTTSAKPSPLPTHLSQWIFALLTILDKKLTSDQISTLRQLARTLMRFGGWAWIQGVMSGEIAVGWGMSWDVSGQAEAGQSGQSGLSSQDIGPDQPAHEGQEQEQGAGETVQDTLATSWIIVHAISAGWGQHDLIDDLETLFK